MTRPHPTEIMPERGIVLGFEPETTEALSERFAFVSGYLLGTLTGVVGFALGYFGSDILRSIAASGL